MPRLLRTTTTWLIYAQLGLWGYALYGFGPTVALLRDEQGVSRSLASLHSVAIAAGALVGGAAYPSVVSRLGRERVMWGGLGGMAAGIGLLSLFRSLPLTIAAALVFSSAGSLLISGVVTSLVDLHGEGRHAAIAEANAVACGLGALAPLTIGLSVDAGWTWRPGSLVVLLPVGGLAVAAILFRIRIPVGGPDRAVSVIDRPGRLPRRYWMAWLAIAFTGSVEVCLGLWAVDVLTSRDAMTAGAAASTVAVIVLGMFLGRLAGGRLALRVPPTTLLLTALGLSLCGFFIFWIASGPTLAVLGLFVCGLGNAMHYPLSVGLAVTAAGPRLADRGMATTSYAVAISFGAAPFALGAAADGFGPHRAFLLVPVFLMAAAVVAGRLRRLLLLSGQREPVADGHQDHLHPVVLAD